MNQTGSIDAEANKAEAVLLLNKISATPYYQFLTKTERNLLESEAEKFASVGMLKYSVAGGTLFKLRDIKDKLVERGVL